MIIGVGTDIVEVERVLQACGNETFLRKYYTPKEQRLIEQRRSRAATNFAAKEAVSKVFGTGFRGFCMKEIEVLRDEKGRPYVVLHGGAKELAQTLGIRILHLSLSDCAQYATAFAVGEGETECMH